jgi:hypothetical protein
MNGERISPKDRRVMLRQKSRGLLSAMVLPVGLALAVQGSTPDAASTERGSSIWTHSAAVSYSTQVVPILEQYCVSCHGGEETELGYDLTTYEGLMAGSDYGPVIEPGDPDGSLFLEMIVNGDMPEDGDPVPAAEIEILRTWIAEGAQNN